VTVKEKKRKEKKRKEKKTKEKKRKEKKRKEKKVLDLETSVAFNCLRKAHDLQSVCNDVQLSDWLAMF
jgi:hypothetical protein